MLLSNPETAVLMKKVLKTQNIANSTAREMMEKTERYINRTNFYEQ
jgi:hypothetical protein